jgi:hypothetical protein
VFAAEQVILMNCYRWTSSTFICCGKAFFIYILHVGLVFAGFTGELEETAADLETSRRKLASLRNQKDVVVAPPAPGLVPGIKSDHGEKGSSENFFKESKELESALEEAKVCTIATSDSMQFRPCSKPVI